MLERRQDKPEEIASGPHRYNETTKAYERVTYQVSEEFPFWLYKDGKSRQVKDATEKKKFLAKGWSLKPPAIAGATDPDDEDEDSIEVKAEEPEMSDDLVPETSAPSEFPVTIYMGTRSREVQDEKELNKRLKLGWSRKRSKKVA